jgi:hypothetical protein
MSLVNIAIPNLFNGVSQQSPSVRQPAQCEEQENASSSIVDGLHKRPPTNFLAKLSSDPVEGNPFLCTINRDSDEKYVLAINNGTVRVWDLLGNEKLVRMATSGQSTQYLSSKNPAADLYAITMADTTFILNKKVKVRRDYGGTVKKVSFTFIGFAPEGRLLRARYSIRVCGATPSYEAIAPISGDGLATYFEGQLKASFTSQYTVTRVGDTVSVEATSQTYPLYGLRAECLACWLEDSGADWVEEDRITIDANNFTSLTFSTYGAYKNLPATGDANTTYRITGDADNQWTTYYCRWISGSYVESVGTSMANAFDPATLPQMLQRTADGSFLLTQGEWDIRLVGDETTNAPPSFVDTTISDMFFFRNRLGFLARDNVIFSRAGDFFNFWRETATQILDSDPIDVSASHIKVSDLKHAIPFNKNLLLFSELTQFTLTASTDALTPKTAAIHPSTEFECSKRVKPAAVGSNTYFVIEKGDYAAIREYFTSPYTNTYDASDVTAHVPKYLPGNVTKLATSSNYDILVAQSGNTPNELYVYKFYWSGDEKLQSSWSKWPLKENTRIHNIDFMGTKLFILLSKPDGLYIEYIDIQEALTEDDLPFQVLLDRKVKLTGTYDAVRNSTTWTLPYAESDVRVVLGGKKGGLWRGAKLNTTSQPTPNTVTAPGDYSYVHAYIGVPYKMRYRFSPQYVRDGNNQTISGAKCKIRNFRVIYNKSGAFRVEVTPEARPTTVNHFTGVILGKMESVLGEVAISSGTFQFPVFTDGVTATIELINDSHLPSFFQSAEWDGFLVERSQRNPNRK